MVPREAPFPHDWHSHLSHGDRLALGNLLENMHAHADTRPELKVRVPRTIHGVKNRGDLERMLTAVHNHIAPLRGPEFKRIRTDLVRMEAYVRKMQRSGFKPQRGKPKRYRS